MHFPFCEICLGKVHSNTNSLTNENFKEKRIPEETMGASLYPTGPSLLLARPKLFAHTVLGGSGLDTQAQEHPKGGFQPGFPFKGPVQVENIKNLQTLS